MGPGRSSSLRIGGDSSVVAGSGRTGGTSDRSAEVDLRDALGGGGGGGGRAFLLNKGKGRIDEVKNPCRMLWRWDLGKLDPCMGPL